jgi:hypothetical protein
MVLIGRQVIAKSSLELHFISKSATITLHTLVVFDRTGTILLK